MNQSDDVPLQQAIGGIAAQVSDLFASSLAVQDVVGDLARADASRLDAAALNALQGLDRATQEIGEIASLLQRIAGIDALAGIEAKREIFEEIGLASMRERFFERGVGPVEDEIELF